MKFIKLLCKNATLLDPKKQRHDIVQAYIADTEETYKSIVAPRGTAIKVIVSKGAEEAATVSSFYCIYILAYKENYLTLCKQMINQYNDDVLNDHLK